MSFLKRIFNPVSKNRELYSERTEEIDFQKSIDTKNKSNFEASLELNDKIQAKVQNLNPESPVKTALHEITSVEISFLKYIDGADYSEFVMPIYWYAEYNLDFDYTVSRLINLGYLQFQNPYFKTTKSGKLLLKTRYQKSITKDIDFEDECLKYILESDLNKAYRVVAKREMNKNIPRGIGVSWESEYENGLEERQLMYYLEKIRNTGCFVNALYLSTEDIEKVKASVILSVFLGIPYHRLNPLLKRLTGLKSENKNDLLSRIYRFREELYFDI